MLNQIYGFKNLIFFPFIKMQTSLIFLQILYAVIKTKKQDKNMILVRYNIASTTYHKNDSSNQNTLHYYAISDSSYEYIFITKAYASLYTSCYIEILLRYAKKYSLSSYPVNAHNFVFDIFKAIKREVIHHLVNHICVNSYLSIRNENAWVILTNQLDNINVENIFDKTDLKFCINYYKQSLFYISAIINKTLIFGLKAIYKFLISPNTSKIKCMHHLKILMNEEITNFESNEMRLFFESIFYLPMEDCSCIIDFLNKIIIQKNPKDKLCIQLYITPYIFTALLQITGLESVENIQRIPYNTNECTIRSELILSEMSKMLNTIFDVILSDLKKKNCKAILFEVVFEYTLLLHLLEFYYDLNEEDSKKILFILKKFNLYFRHYDYPSYVKKKVAIINTNSK